jgi:hypothetical protein
MVHMELAQVPKITAPAEGSREMEVEITFMALEARCDQIDAMLAEARERCREGRERLDAYRAAQRKVSVRWH